MANFLNYIIESSIQPVKTNVLWIKEGVPYYYNKRWKPLLSGGSGGSYCPIQFGDGEISAVLIDSNSQALNEYSLALGYNTVVNNKAEVAFGTFNKSVISDDSSKATLFSIGNGSEEERKNALELKYDGSLFLQNLDKSVQESFGDLLKKQLQFDSFLDELKGSITATKNQLRSEYTQIKTDLSGDITELNSSITQTAENITLEVNKKVQTLDGKIQESSSKIDQTAEQIRLEVNKEIKNLDGKIEKNASSITQTADQIRLEVTETVKDLDGKIENNSSSITQTAKEIRLEVESITETLDGKISKASTAIEQTSESISLLAEKTEALENKTVEYDSSFIQTAEQIATAVSRIDTTEEGVREAKASITQTANNIRSEVSEQVQTLGGRIDQNATSITQTKDAINLRVDSLEGTVNSKTGELEGKIAQNTTAIEQTKESINLKVDGSEFNTLKGTVEEHSSSILLNTESIKSKVEKETFDALSGAVESGFTEVEQTIDGITTTIGGHTGQITSINSTLEGLTVALGKAEAKIENLEKQSDGAIDTHFGTEKPTLNNLPASEWTTESLKREHVGDIYYNNITGEAYRFSYNPDTNEYFWVELTDSALTDALDKISQLEVAIDGKVTIFYTTPSNYKEGDLWFVDKNYEATGSLPALTKGQLVTANKNNSNFNRADWEDKTNFASKEEVEASANQLNTYIDGAFKDGVLEEAEIAQINELKKTFELTFSEITESYNILYISAIAAEEDKTSLKRDYDSLKNAYNLLMESIEGLVEGTYLLDDYKENYASFLEAIKVYYKTASKYTDSIQSAISSIVDTLVSITSDGVLTPSEKTNLFNIWKSISEEFSANRGVALNYKIIELRNGVYQQRTDIYKDDTYWLIYKNYQDAFTSVQEFFTASINGKNVLGFDAMHENTTLPDDFDLTSITNSLEIYYAKLALFAEMISKIVVEITDAHDKAIEEANRISELLQPQDNISVIGKGVILSSVIAVQSNNVIQAGLNATEVFKDKNATNNHGRIVFAGGINGKEDWNEAKTVIYEDGYVHFRWGSIEDAVELGNAIVRTVDADNINVLSFPIYDKSGKKTLVPLFQINTDSNGNIVSVSSVYAFNANKNVNIKGNLVVQGDISST